MQDGATRIMDEEITIKRCTVPQGDEGDRGPLLSLSRERLEAKWANSRGFGVHGASGSCLEYGKGWRKRQGKEREDERGGRKRAEGESTFHI